MNESGVSTLWVVYADHSGHGEGVLSIHSTEMGAYAAMKGWMEARDMEMDEWVRVGRKGIPYPDDFYVWKPWGDESWMRRGGDSVRIKQMELCS